MNTRKERGQNIANSCKITERDDYYLVPSQTEKNKRYIVRLGKEVSCNCPDFKKRGEEIGRCKHIFAVEIRFTEYRDHRGNTVKEQTTKITYSQDWNAYDKSQTTEKEMVMKLLNDLCEEVEQPEYSFGRPKLPLRDIVFASAFKVYSTFSLRRFTSDMRTAQEKGYILKAPCFTSVGKYFQNRKMTSILYKLIQITSLPLSSVETNFAVDSSGFSTGVFSRWFDHKYGQDKEKRDWLKAHITIGTKTNIITAVKITEGYSADITEFEDLIKKTSKNFKIGEVSADKAYSSKDNYDMIEGLGGKAFIPFRRNASPRSKGSWAWKKMYHYFQLNQEEFMEHYHKRSNVETTFSMIKRKFGSNIRSKDKVAQVNEVLLKILCHNICVLIQETNELGISTDFSRGVKVA